MTELDCPFFISCPNQADFLLGYITLQPHKQNNSDYNNKHTVESTMAMTETVFAGGGHNLYSLSFFLKKIDMKNYGEMMYHAMY